MDQAFSLYGKESSTGRRDKKCSFDSTMRKETGKQSDAFGEKLDGFNRATRFSWTNG